MGFFDRLDFEAETIVEADRRTVVLNVKRKRPWGIVAGFHFWPVGGDRPVLEFDARLDEEQKQFRISEDEIQAGEFELRVFSFGPLGIVGKKEGTVKIP